MTGFIKYKAILIPMELQGFWLEWSRRGCG